MLNAKLTTVIKPWVDSITEDGVLTIYFNDTMMKPINKTMIRNNSALAFYIIPASMGPGPPVANITDWEVLHFLSNSIVIQLTFDDPRMISIS